MKDVYGLKEINYAELSNSILAVDWLFEFDRSSVHNCFLYLVSLPGFG